jgi:hypothetical protein
MTIHLKLSFLGDPLYVNFNSTDGTIFNTIQKDFNCFIKYGQVRTETFKAEDVRES